MDFIDLDSFLETVDLPQPQPALSLPISSNIENLGKRFTSFNSLTKNFLNFDEKETEEEGIEVNNDDLDNYNGENLAEKYANLSLGVIEKESNEDESADVAEEDGVPKSSSLSIRLSRVLNNSLSDSQLRELFINLEEEFPGTAEEIDELIEPGVVGSMARKKLRGRLESSLLDNKSKILKEYQPAVELFKSFEEKLKSLNSLNNLTNEKINKNYESSKSFNVEVKELDRQRKIISLKKSLLVNFGKQFSLNEYEEYVLKSGDINDEFFSTLKKAEQVNENCSILLSVDNTQLGVKVMSKINQLIDKAVERIVTYTNRTLSNLYSLNTKLRTVTLHKCLKYLKGRLNYFNVVVDNFTKSRAKQLVEEFMNQVNGNLELSSGDNFSSYDSPRPIFVASHDPVRFIGDLLAYVHSVVVNESETIISIFTIDDLGGDQEQEEFKDIIGEIVENTLKSLSRPIKSRVEQTISSETKLATIYSIDNLLELYFFMLSKQLKNTSAILASINELVGLTQDKIINTIGNRLATIEASNLAQLELNLDLQPPEWTMEFYSEIIPLIEQSTTDTLLNFPPDSNQKLIKLIVDRPIGIFYHHVESNKLFGNKRDSLIIKENFLDFVISRIMPLAQFNDKVLEISETMDKLTEELTDLQFTNIIKECGIYDLYNVICMICPLTDDFFDVSIYEPITQNKLFTKDKIDEINQIVQEFLPNALIKVQDSLMKVNSPLVVNNVTSESSMRFTKFYKCFNLISEEYLQTLLTWSVMEVATLLGVEEDFLRSEDQLKLES
ncbi:uncharacterized protein PRCAT00004766001 [Priceomyces carsonii]|uniref:uncharacterized protein n=1 Tax=Priceomyces carsonii TaxID=28549 RepID=UPI002EDB2988|nr:unnamed protein product [Priceomyces carsonii]